VRTGDAGPCTLTTALAGFLTDTRTIEIEGGTDASTNSISLTSVGAISDGNESTGFDQSSSGHILITPSAWLPDLTDGTKDLRNLASGSWSGNLGFFTSRDAGNSNEIDSIAFENLRGTPKTGQPRWRFEAIGKYRGPSKTEFSALLSGRNGSVLPWFLVHPAATNDDVTILVSSSFNEFVPATLWDLRFQFSKTITIRHTDLRLAVEVLNPVKAGSLFGGQAGLPGVGLPVNVVPRALRGSIVITF
jgi:hypothetical protein